MDIRSFSQEFINNLEKTGKSFNTVKNYRNDLKCFFDFVYSKQNNYNLRDVSGNYVLEYSAHLDHKYNADNSKRRRVQALRLFFDYLVGQGIYSENPIRKIPVSAKKLDIPKPTEYLEIIQLKNFISKKIAMSEGIERLNAKRNMIIFYLVYGSGLKVADIKNLKMAHILKGKDGLRVLVTPEKYDPYSVPLPSQFNEYFNDYQDELGNAQRLLDFDFDDLLYNANAYQIIAGGLSERGLELIFKSMSTEIKLKITAKSLRQSCILKWINLGEPESRIKEWMGVRPSYTLKMYREYFKNHRNDCNFTEL